MARRPCPHTQPLNIHASVPSNHLRLSDSAAPLVRVQSRSLRMVQWCAQCGALGQDGAWVHPLEALAREGEVIDPR